MGSIFGGGDQNLINISIYYKIDKNNYDRIIILKEEEGKKKINKEEESIFVLNTKWIQRTWGEDHDLMKESFSYNPTSGEREFDWVKYEENMMIRSLVEWDALDDIGNNVPCDSVNIDKLVAPIAQALIAKYRIITGGDTEETKK